MYITINPQKSGGRHGKSAARYVNYLEKENRGKSATQQEYFFDANSDKVSNREVTQQIDGNTAKLESHVPRYYTIILCPSQRELRHIQNKSEKLKTYTRKLMKDYVRCFNREIFGRRPKTSDILYYGKIEKERTFKTWHREVRENTPFIKKIAALRDKEDSIRQGNSDGSLKKIQRQIKEIERTVPHKTKGVIIEKGTSKPGLQMHVHLIVSRKDRTNTVSLSPGSKYIASNVKWNGKEIKRGFHRDRFFDLAEKRFDREFKFQRNFAECYTSRKKQLRSPKSYYTSLLKLPTSERKLAMKILSKSGAAIPDAKLHLALKQIHKATSIGLKSSSIGY